MWVRPRGMDVDPADLLRSSLLLPRAGAPIRVSTLDIVIEALHVHDQANLWAFEDGFCSSSLSQQSPLTA